MNSFTITFTGQSSTLNAQFFPPIDLADGKYEIGFVDFQSYNSIYNVNKPNNVLYYHEPKEFTETPKGTMTLAQFSDRLKEKLGTTIHVRNGKLSIFSSKQERHILRSRGAMLTLDRANLKSSSDKITVTENVWYCDLTEQETKTITIPEGNYEISEIEKEVQKTLPEFKLIANNILMKSSMISSKVFNFVKEGMGKQMLGFVKYSEPNVYYNAYHKININNVNVVRIKCNIASGSFINGKLDHSIHSFFPLVPPGYKLVEVSRHLIYYPINVRTLDNATVTIVDQNDNIINFHDEEITIRCHIRKSL